MAFAIFGSAAMPAGTVAQTVAAASALTAALSEAYATVLFSRSEMTAADNCVARGDGIADLSGTVAPYLASLHMSGTGTLVTGKTLEASQACTHYNDSLMASWADATALAQNYGWSFVSHTATYPALIASLSPARSYAETCGSAAAIDAHGLPGGHGMIAYPGSQPTPTALQTDYSANCFAWGRSYNYTGTTNASAGTISPYWQITKAINGGPCNLATAACYTYTAIGSARYNLPAPIVTRIKALKAGQWFTLQAYILVVGTSPAYSSNGTKWDCTSQDPKLHWSNDNERYCYSDWQQIVAAIAARADIVVTDPLHVGVAFGRPATY